MIIRGYILPKRGDRGPVYVEEISEEEARAIYNDTCSLIKATLDEFTRRGSAKIRSAEEMNLFLNAFVAYVKSLLTLEAIPEKYLSEARALQPSVRALFFYLSWYDEFRDLNEEDRPYGKRGGRIMHRILELSEKRGAALYTDEMREKLYRILKFPADTRPGANTSSLLIHAMTASAIASSILINGVESHQSRARSLAVLRLACLFHDIGKMVEWREHESVSSMTLNSLFSEYVDGDAKSIISEAASLIQERTHPLRKYLIQADVTSSELDRIVEMFESLMRSSPSFVELEEKAKVWGGLRRAYMKWEFWRGVGDDLVRSLTEEFCRRASSISEGTLNCIRIKPKLLNPNVEMVRVDVRGIQSYIRLNDIWAMNGASREIDYILYVALPAYLIEKFEIPLESVLYSGGGNVTLALPKNLVSRLDELCKHFNDTFFKGTPSYLIYGRSPLYNSFPWINSEIEEDLLRKKIFFWTAGLSRTLVDPNIYARCEVCGRYYAELQREGKAVCEACSRRLEFGREHHFSVRSRALGLDWGKLSKCVIEYIAGHPACPEPAEEQLNYAMVKFDGNLVGQLIGSSISLTDACERSFRIDSSVKIAVRSFLESLDVEDVRRLILGLMYVGGDDGVIMMPSRLALPFALHLLNEYYLNMGCKSSLSVGILAVKPKHPLINSIEASNELLSIAKSGETRRLSYEEVHAPQVSEPSNKFRGALVLFVSDTGWVTKETVSQVLSDMKEDGLSRMRESYILADPGEEGSVLRLTGLVDAAYGSLGSIDAKSLIEAANKHFNDDRRLKTIRSVIYSIVRSSKFEGVGNAPYLIYMARESASAPDMERRDIFREMIRKLVDRRMRIMLQDLYLVVKLIGGGRI